MMEEYFGNPEDSVINSGNDLLLTTAAASSSARTVTISGSSRISTIFLIINAALGAGLLNFPQAFDQAGGILTAICMQAALLVWIFGALLILAHCSDQTGANTLQDILEGACGRKGLVACALCVALYCFGTCVTFQIIIGDQFDRVLSSLYGSDFCHFWYMNRKFTITASSVVLILPLCYSRRIDFLKYVSYVGVSAVVYVVALVVYEKLYGDFVPGPIKTQPDKWTDVFLVVPVICFAYQCHVSVIPIYACLEQRSLRSFSVCAGTALCACVLAYSLTGAFGYLTFGGAVRSDVLESYSGASWPVLAAVTSLAVKTFTTYPILLFCGREAVSNLYVVVVAREPDVALTERRRRYVISTAWFCLTLALAVVSPDIGVVIDVLGSLAAVFIFVFPGICWLQSTLHKDPLVILNKDKLTVAVAAIFILLGTFLFGVVLVQALQRLGHPPPVKVKICV